MTTHELARLLLAGPDLTAIVFDWESGAHTEITGVSTAVFTFDDASPVPVRKSELAVALVAE